MQRLKTHLILAASVVLLTACASQQQQSSPPTSVPPTPPSSSPPSSSPPSPPTSSPSSSPSATPPSAPDQSSRPPSQPTMGQPSSPSPSGPPSSEPASDSEQKRKEAAEALKRAGQQIADQNEQMSDTLPSDMQTGGGNEEWDPLIPDSEQVSNSESDTFMESDPAQQPASSSDAADSSSAESAQEQDMASAEADDLMMPDMSDPTMSDPTMSDSGSESGGELSDGGEMMNDDLADDIRAAQEALEQASIALQTAGTTLETATTDEELAEAEAALGRARLAVIIAGQDLMDIMGNPDFDIDPVQEDIFLETKESLNEANVAIVIATDSVFSTRLELPDFNAGLPGSPGSPGSEGSEQGGQSGDGGQGGRQGELDKALNESIGIFEGKILEARQEVLSSAPPPTSSSNIPGVAILGGGQGDEFPEGGTLEENGEGLIEVGVPDVIQQGNMPDGGEVARVEMEGGTPPIPEDIPDPQGDDIVAQQLREAAIAETDPELKAKLWEEYKRYRAGL